MVIQGDKSLQEPALNISNDFKHKVANIRWINEYEYNKILGKKNKYKSIELSGGKFMISKSKVSEIQLKES